MGSWSVDRVDLITTPIIDLPTPPAPQLTGVGYSLAINVKKTYIGQYAVRIHYESPQNNAVVEKTFMIYIYPETEYSHPAQATTCVPDIFPATLGNRAGITITDGDVATNNFMVCGSV